MNRRTSVFTCIGLLLLLGGMMFYLPCATNAQSASKTPTVEELAREVAAFKKETEYRDEYTSKRMDLIWNVAPWALGLITGLLGIVTFMQRQSESKYMGLLQKQMEDAQKTASEVRENITRINTLITSFKNIVDFAKDQTQNAEALAGRLKDAVEGQVNIQAKLLNDVNQRAIKLTIMARRNSMNDNDFRSLVAEFVIDQSTIQGIPEFDRQLNANYYYIMGFARRIRDEYDEAIECFESAVKRAVADSEAGPSEEIKSRYPGIPTDRTLEQWLRKLRNVCFYHAGIIVYNLGCYTDACDYFRKALDADPTDYACRTYIPEAKFLGDLVGFEEIVKEFEEVIRRMEGLTEEDTRDFTSHRSGLLAQAYLKLGNCYFVGKDHRPNWSVAIKHYREAMRHDEKSSIYRFSLALALSRSGNTEELEYRKLLSGIIGDVRNRAYQSEARIAMMYCYILAIAYAYGENPDIGMAMAPLERIRELRQQLLTYKSSSYSHLPKGAVLRIFSPWSKRDRTVEEFMTEIEEIEQRIARIAPIGSLPAISSPVGTVALSAPPDSSASSSLPRLTRSHFRRRRSEE